jgi:uncharacterized protein YidB (DUF937 family)
MGLLDDITKGAMDKISSLSGQNPLLEQALNLINNPQTGGLAGLVENFKNKGLGDIMSSWISTGENKTISGEQISNLLGSDQIKSIANKAGLGADKVQSELSSLIPLIIDKLTPDGKLPESNLLEQAMKMFKGKTVG